MIESKPLKPSLREKKRYIRFEILSEKSFSFGAVQKAIETAFHGLVGTLGAAKTGLILVQNKWDEKKQSGVIRINRGYVDHVRALFCMMQTIDKKQMVIRSIRASGMINKV